MKRITVPEEGIETLFGSYDENLKHLETLFNVRIRTQGHELLVDGDSPDLEKVDRVVGQLSSLMRDGYKLSNSDVKTASSLVAQDDSVDLRDHFLKGSLMPGGKRRVAPKTVNQRRYLDAIDQHDIVFGIGPAGTGKTYLAMAQAVASLGAKAVITGDVTQIDLPAGRTSGLVEAMKVVHAIDGISFVHFDERDVVRHKLVQQIVKAYEAFTNGNGDHRGANRSGR